MFGVALPYLAGLLLDPAAADPGCLKTRDYLNDNGVKLFADGAMFSQAMQIGDPGYIDGHHGEWITQPAPFEEFARRYWQAGYQIHVHTNGDGGVKRRSTRCKSWLT